MSIFDFTQKDRPAASDAEPQEDIVEEVPVEPVSERELLDETPQEPVKEEAEEMLRHAFPPEDLKPVMETR